MKRLVVILIILLTAMNLPVRAADLLDIGTSARSLGMGRAYVGITDVGECVFGNPAGLSGLRKLEMVSMYTDLSGDVKYTLVGAAAPAGPGRIGFGYASNKIGDIFATTIDATGRPSTLEPFSYGTDMFLVDYAGSINKDLAYGLRFKYIEKGGTIASAGQGKGMNLDLGVSYRINDDASAGAVIENLIAGGPGALKWSNGVEEEMPFVFNIGGSYRLKKFNTKAYYDFSFRKTRSYEMRLGAEWNVWRSLDLRAGLEQMNLGPAEKYLNYSLGVGLKFDGFRVDYAYYADTLLAYNSRHYVSIAVSLPELPARRVVNVTAEAADTGYLGDIGVFTEDPDGKYRPGDYITRAGFVKIVETAVLKEKSGTEGNDTYSFIDVPLAHWAAPYIVSAKKRGYITGYPDLTFKPDKILTRAECIKIMETILIKERSGAEKKASRSFYDVPASHWAARYIISAKDSGYVTGYPGQKFRPGKMITKKEVLDILKQMNMADAINQLRLAPAAKAKTLKAKNKAKTLKAKKKTTTLKALYKAKALKALNKAKWKEKIKKTAKKHRHPVRQRHR